ncbi:TRAP transporter small permease [Aurantimonas sp. 22II-16-19i]|uniref:TRAP transporter small permease n=1 Tax=Aurantimonas sp. 22II-16-19i TaxID=1317114 RepID=UPI0009F7D419|nr:TRAP transporter small permease [Aurantimonas sp. 22II-16-19i]ORE89658.1 Sialic acid TRAP transporter permease protein [Aurantimonas sp. 22II-16-19i]
MSSVDPTPGIGAEAPGAHPDEPIDLSDLRWSDGVVLVLFWVLAGVVFLQFFTRYVLNDSLGWTEEIARFLLIGVTFVGSIMAARKESHIAVELFYRYFARRARFALQIVVDLVSLGFYVAMTWLCISLAGRTHQKMVSIDLPKSAVYWIVAVSLGLMAIYAAVALLRHLRSGTSRLVDPERFAVSTKGV